MEKKYSYKNLEAYKESKALVVTVYQLIKKFPKEENYALCDQLRRAVVSVPSNIAEGSGRTSAKDQAHFFEMAYGSLMEVDCQIEVARRLGYISEVEWNAESGMSEELERLLSGLRSSISKAEREK